MRAKAGTLKTLSHSQMGLGVSACLSPFIGHQQCPRSWHEHWEGLLSFTPLCVSGLLLFWPFCLGLWQDLFSLQLSLRPELRSESSQQISLHIDTPPPTASARSSSSEPGLFFQFLLTSQQTLLTSDQETQKHPEPFIQKINIYWAPTQCQASPDPVVNKSDTSLSRGRLLSHGTQTLNT